MRAVEMGIERIGAVRTLRRRAQGAFTNGVTMSYRRLGFTLTELLVTIVIFLVVAGLLAFPLLSAFGYIQKAMARHEAQQAASKAASQLAHELSTAMYIYDLPPDGSWVSFLLESNAASATNLIGMPMYSANASATSWNTDLVRYGVVPDFPWIAAGASATAWTLLKPNYLASSSADNAIYTNYHQPYYTQAAAGVPPNPFIVTRFQQSISWDNAWSQAPKYSLNGCYPMDDSTLFPAGLTRDLLWRNYRNHMIAITPLGESWDVPRFQVSPLRLTSESLVLQADAWGRTLPTVALARYPLWVGRSRDLDDLSDAELTTLYPSRTLAQLDDLLKSWTYLYPTRRVNAAWAAGTPATPPNPYGYQIRVYNTAGSLVYGTNYSNTANAYTMNTRRHFMDWPPVDRPDWDWTSAATGLWTQNDVARQRMEGKVVFAQPVIPCASIALAVTDYAKATATVTLNIPAGSWESSRTVLVTPPQRITLTKAGVDKVFKLVNKPVAQLGSGEFCVVNAGLRQIAFGEDLPGNWTVTPAHAHQALYTISDLQPDDVVVATYSTKAILDLVLTVSRQDRAGKGEFSRQDYPINLRIEARNAIKRARGNR